MAYYITKIVITIILIIAISEVSKRSSMIGAILASVPLVSVIAMIWLYFDTSNTEKVAELASSIFWLVIPSLALFVSLPILLKLGVNFYLSMGISITITIFCYWLMVTVLRYFGVSL